MSGFLRQSTAAQARLIGPFVDDTDFKTAETGLTVANTDIKLRANGTTLSNKNSGGGTHQANGMYSVTWDATDTANVGELSYSVVVSGALQVFGSYTVLEEAVYDALFAASALGYVDGATVNATKIGGTTQTGRDLGASVLLSSGTGTGQVLLSSGTVTTGAISNNAITAASLAADAGGEIADAVWDEALSGHTTAGTAGKQLQDISTGSAPSAAAVADAVWDEALAGHLSPGSTGAALDGIQTTVGGIAPPTSADIADAVWDETLADHLTAGSTGEALDNSGGSGGTAPTAEENAEALLKFDMSTISGEAARSPVNAFRFLRNRWRVQTTTLQVFKEDDSTEAWTSDLSASAGANPIVQSDPA